MSATDTRLQYQKVVGGSLDSINRIAENNRPAELQDYIEWLESIASCYFLTPKVKAKFEKALNETRQQIK